jgi:hypothetical protein
VLSRASFSICSGRSPCQVGLEREPLELVHELHVVAEHLGNAARALERRQPRIVAQALDCRDAPLDLAHGLEIAIDMRAIRGPQRACELRKVLRNGVEDAAVLVRERDALRRRAAVAE